MHAASGFHRLVSLPSAESRAADNGTKEVVALVAELGLQSRPADDNCTSRDQLLNSPRI
jgi:hypothetical protein